MKKTVYITLLCLVLFLLPVLLPVILTTLTLVIGAICGIGVGSSIIHTSKLTNQNETPSKHVVRMARTGEFTRDWTAERTADAQGQIIDDAVRINADQVFDILKEAVK